LGIVVCLVAIVLRSALDPVLYNFHPFVTFYAAVAFAAWSCGVGPALLNMVAGLIAARYLYHTGSSIVPESATVVATIGYLFVNAMIIAFAAENRRALAKAGHAAREADDARNLFHTFMDNSPALSFMRDEAGTYVYYNRRARELLGLAENSMPSPDVPSGIADLSAHDAEILASGKPQRFVETTNEKDGQHHWLSFKFPIVETDGRKFVGTKSFDITELRRAQEALNKAQERLLLAQQAADLALWELDASSGRFTLFNQIAVLRSLGVSNNREAWIHLIHPEDRDRVVRQFDEAIRNGRDYESEYRVIDQSGQVHWIAVRGRVLPGQDGHARVMGVAFDVTEHKKTEEALLQSQRLASVGRMAATVAHEINNPLEAVFNLLYLAMTDPGVTPDVRRRLDMAQQELERVSEITKQTLGFYREKGAARDVDLRELMDQVLRLYERRLHSKAIAVTKQYSGREKVRGTPGELRQVLSNLLLNAIEATSQQGRLHIRISEADAVKNEPMMRITIADTGTGIDPELRDSIFEPFFTTKKDVGTGLGLWVTSGIVKKHGGSLHLRSQKGRGTVVSIFLPAAAKTKDSIQLPAAA
jgi:PAS domain S-box-containing protein